MHSHLGLSPSLWVNQFEFLDELFIAKTRVLGLSVEDFMILNCVSLTQCQRVTDGRTDRRTDKLIVANTRLCIQALLTPCKNEFGPDCIAVFTRAALC